MTAERDLLTKLLAEVRAPRISLSITNATYLVEVALRHDAITPERAAELLGLTLDEAYKRWAWVSAP